MKLAKMENQTRRSWIKIQTRKRFGKPNSQEFWKTKSQKIRKTNSQDIIKNQNSHELFNTKHAGILQNETRRKINKNKLAGYYKKSKFARTFLYETRRNFTK